MKIWVWATCILLYDFIHFYVIFVHSHTANLKHSHVKSLYWYIYYRFTFISLFDLSLIDDLINNWRKVIHDNILLIHNIFQIHVPND